MVQMPANDETKRLPTFERSLQQKLYMLKETIRGVLEEISDHVENGECVTRYTKERHNKTFLIAATRQNLNCRYHRLVSTTNQQRVFLANTPSLLQNAMASLAHRCLPIALIPQAILLKILDIFETYGRTRRYEENKSLHITPLMFLEMLIYRTRGCICFLRFLSIRDTEYSRIPRKTFHPNITANRTRDTVLPVKDAVTHIPG